jgi:hypothetical protein
MFIDGAYVRMKRLLGIALFLCIILMSLPLALAQENSTGNTAFATNTPLANNSSPETTATPSAAATDDEGAPVVLEFPEECAYVEGEGTSDDCIAFMQAHPEPEVTEILRDGTTLSLYSFWRVGPQAVNTYDAPNGNVTGQIPQGFNFVNVVNQTEGWIQAEDGAWINQADAYYVTPSNFVGVLLPEDWRLPIGWVLDTTGIYASAYPGGPADSATGLVPLHYQRFNIFAEVADAEGWLWYLVGPNQWVKQVFMSVIKPTERPESVSGTWVAVDLFEQTLVAYQGHQPIFATLISTGLPGTETNEGIFDVWARLQSDSMSGATGAPNAYALQSVPWVQYFDGSISLHGTYWHDFFGYRRSRGCVNLSISDAKWVFEFFNSTIAAEESAFVYVHSSGEYRGE